MFPKKNRFSFKNKLPKNVLNSPSFTIRYESNDEGLKAAVVVSKKVEKAATGRNKIRRKIRELVRKKLYKENINIVLFVKGAVKVSTGLPEELEGIIKRIKNV